MTTNNLVYAPSSNIILVQNIKDAYGNILANQSLTLSGQYIGSWSSPTINSIIFSTDASGNATVITQAVNIGGVMKYTLVGSSLSVQYNEWFNQNQFMGVMDVSCAFVIDSTGKLWGWGANNFGQVGDGTGNYAYSPVQVANISNIIAVAGGSRVAYALDSSGKVWSWGGEISGNIGNNTTSGTYYSPVQVSNLSNIVSIAGGTNGLALDSSGHVWAWGNNQYGGVGLGSVGGVNPSPTQVPSLVNIVAIAGMSNANCALDSSGNVWTWGQGGGGLLGNGSLSDTGTPSKVSINNIVAIAGGDDGYALDSSGNVWAWGPGDYQLNGSGSQANTPIKIAGLSNIVSMAVSNDNTFHALDSSGRIWSMGDDSDYQFGNGSNTSNGPMQSPSISNVIGICGSMAITSNGTAWYWGHTGGMLGETPIQVSGGPYKHLP